MGNLTGECGDNTTWSLDGNVLTIRGTGEISGSAFEDREDIKEVIIEDGVLNIGERAFESCTSLTKITIPDSITKIEWSAFCDCISLALGTIQDFV